MKKYMLISKLVLAVTINTAMPMEKWDASPYPEEKYGNLKNLEYMLENHDGDICPDAENVARIFLKLDDNLDLDYKKKLLCIQEMCQALATLNFQKTDIVLNESKDKVVILRNAPLIKCQFYSGITLLRDFSIFFQFSEPIAYSLAYALMFRDKNFSHEDKKTPLLKAYIAREITNSQVFVWHYAPLPDFFAWLIKNPDENFKSFVKEELLYLEKNCSGEGTEKKEDQLKRALRIIEELQRREINGEPWYIGDSDDLYKK